MYNIYETDDFDSLKPYFISAIQKKIINKNDKAVFLLSGIFEGQEVMIKKSEKKMKFAGFDDVILGAVMRMKRLFKNTPLNLGVIISKKPDSNNMAISFELVNKNVFKIADEEYFLSIVAEYSFKKMNVVTYYPIVYRQECSNGMVAILSKNFKETIDVRNMFDIGCEWTPCNFEIYKNRLTNYFNYLKRTPVNILNRERTISLMNRLLKPKKNQAELYSIGGLDSYLSIEDVIEKNIAKIGNNEFALWNAITEYASRESDLDLRNQNFSIIGKYIFNQMNKTLKTDREKWSESVDWKELVRLINE